MDRTVKKRIPIDDHLEFKISTNPDEISVLFGRWLLHYFSPWNPGDDTWVDVENKSYYTNELFEIFKEELLNHE